MRILLVKPYTRNNSISPPLGLGYLASSLDPAHQVKILDGDLLALTPDKLARVCRQEMPDMVGIQTYSANLPLIRNYLQGVRAAAPGALTVLGGPHPSAAAEATLRYFGPDLDLVVAGEAESTFTGLTRWAAENPGRPGSGLNGLAGVSYMKGAELMSTARGPYEKIEQLPWPAWDLIRPEAYPRAPHGAFYKQWPAAPILVSRGCPYDCGFCMARVVCGQVIRYRPVADVIAEISYLSKQRGIRELHIVDDCFTASRAYAVEFCEQLLKQDLKLTWTLPNGVRVGSMDRELLALMKQAGCYAISLGIETGSPELLSRTQKGITLDAIYSQTARVKDAGLLCVGFFILGLPGTTAADMEATLKLALDLPLDRANFLFYHPLPGSPMYEELMARGESGAMTAYPPSFADIGFIPAGMTARELKGWQRRMFMRFYARPRVIRVHLSQVHGYRHLTQLLFRSFRWLG